MSSTVRRRRSKVNPKAAQDVLTKSTEVVSSTSAQSYEAEKGWESVAIMNQKGRENMKTRSLLRHEIPEDALSPLAEAAARFFYFTADLPSQNCGESINLCEFLTAEESLIPRR